MPDPIDRPRIDGGGTLNLPGRASELSANPSGPRHTLQATNNVTRDSELDEQIAEERADPAVLDLLNPRAPRE